jgi:hypothetical protein
VGTPLLPYWIILIPRNETNESALMYNLKMKYQDERRRSN